MSLKLFLASPLATFSVPSYHLFPLLHPIFKDYNSTWLIKNRYEHNTHQNMLLIVWFKTFVPGCFWCCINILIHYSASLRLINFTWRSLMSIYTFVCVRERAARVCPGCVSARVRARVCVCLCLCICVCAPFSITRLLSKLQNKHFHERQPYPYSIWHVSEILKFSLKVKL